MSTLSVDEGGAKPATEVSTGSDDPGGEASTPASTLCVNATVAPSGTRTSPKSNVVGLIVPSIVRVTVAVRISRPLYALSRAVSAIVRCPGESAAWPSVTFDSVTALNSCR